MRMPIDGTQRRMRLEAFSCSATAITEGTQRGTFTDNAGSGDFTITFTEPFGRTPVATASATSAAGKLYCTIHTLSTTAVRVLCYSDAGTLTDPTAFHVIVVGSDSADGQL